MKKLYTQQKFKDHALKRERAELKRRKDRIKFYSVRELHLIKEKTITEKVNSWKYSRSKTKQRVKSRRLIKRRNVNAPEVFSFTENTKDTLHFFYLIDTYVKHKHRIFLNLEAVKVMTLDVLIYMLSLFQNYKLDDINYNVLGNSPSDDHCRELITQSGFLTYITSHNQLEMESVDILQIRSGFQVSPIVVKEVIDFCLNHLGQTQSLKTKGIYRILIEMMNNTKEHAYKRDAVSSKWNLITWHDNGSNEIKFAFMDGGYGIPATIRKNFRETLNRKFKKIGGKYGKDYQVIKSATRGEFRSRTRHRYRNKGLPTIYKNFTDGNIGNLKIISNHGFIDYEKNEIFDHDKRFHGTLYTWNFV